MPRGASVYINSNHSDDSSNELIDMEEFLFAFTFSFILLSLAMVVARSRRWCNCQICCTYLTSGWAGEHANLCDWFTHLILQSPTRTVHIHVLDNIITANKKNVKHMLKTRFENYPKGKPFSSILGDLLGWGIFNVDGERWLFQRKLASLELGSVSVRSYAFGIINHETKERLLPLLDSVSDNDDFSSSKSIELQDVFRRFSFDSICKISFGIDPGCLKLSLPMSAFATAFDTATTLSAARATSVSPMIWKMKRLLNLGSERELRKALTLVNVLAEEVIQHRRLDTSSDKSQDLLTRFIDSVGDNKYLRDIVVSFLLAGRDTVASTLTSFFYLLSRHPEVEAEMLAEIDRVMEDDDGSSNNGEVSWGKLREMQYVHAAIHESMRLYPAVQHDSKFAAEDDVLPDGTFVRKGTRVTFHPYAMGRLTEAWGNDCMEFRPQRWLTNGVFTPEDPFKYTVFNASHRICIGKELAVMETKTVIVSVVRKFTVDVITKDQPLSFSPGLTATLRDGLHANITRR